MSKGIKVSTHPDYLVDYDIAYWLRENLYRVDSNYYITYQHELYFYEEAEQITSIWNSYIPVPSIIDVLQWLAEVDIVVKSGKATDGRYYYDIIIKHNSTIAQINPKGRDILSQSLNDAIQHIIDHWSEYTSFMDRMKLIK